MGTKLHYVFSSVLILIGFSVFSQQKFFTKIENTNRINQVQLDSNTLPTQFDKYSIDLDGIRNELINAPQRGENNLNTNLILEFPNLEGKMERYQIFEASVMHPELQAKYPEIRSYAGYGIGTTNFLRFSLSPYNGFNGIILGDKKAIIFQSDNLIPEMVIIFDKSSARINGQFECSTLDILNSSDNLNTLRSADATKHTFDLAMSVTGEYSTYHGGTLGSVNAAINTTITNVNAIFENDFNVNLVLIADNDDVVYLDATTDPYSTDSNYNQELADNLDAVFMDSEYDIGHLMGGIGGNGNAGCIGCVCVDGEVATDDHKGSGFTTNTVPIGPAFDVDYVAHEIGHQFGGNHTFTHASEGGIAQMEPGSGSTIMGYAGITGATDVQLNSDPYFHAISIQQITDHVASRTCDDETAIANNVPVANAGGSPITLPIGTPFKLTGSATDADIGDMLTYCWEQFDENNGLGGGFPDETSTNSDLPLFRSYNPTSSPTRTFPRLLSLVNNGVNGSTWEKVPTVTRSADFRLTVRDNKPGGAANDFDDMVVNWDDTYGPFEVTSQATPGLLWNSGTTKTVTWNVNNTTSLSGATNVNILLSTDGGLTFPTILVPNTPNDGAEDITVPAIPAPYCRILIEPTGNQFFAINTQDFAIDYIVTTTCTQYDSTDPQLPLAITDNGAAYTEVAALTVSQSTTIIDINVGVNITHSWIGDLLIGIQSPAGLLLNMMEPYDPCQNEDSDVIVKFDDDGDPFDCAITGDDLILQSQQASLSGWNGEDSSGQWLIGIGDFGAADVGTLNSWYIEVCEKTEMPLAINESVLDNLFSIYPNPNNGEFSIQVNSSSSNNILIEVYDLRGRLILNKSYNDSGSFNEKLNMGNVESGIYIVNVNDGNRKATKKIVIQ